MLVTEVQFDPTLIAGPLPIGGGTRSTGLHLSEIYRDIEDTLAPREEMAANQLHTYGSMGFIWERVLEHGMIRSLQSDRYVRPGEFTKDGITGSPDLIDLQEWAVVDSKCTWRSSRKLERLEKYFWTWLVQLKGYCAMVGTQDAYLWIFFVNGNWKPPAPEIRAIHLKFSQHEINENWSMIKNHARKRGWM